MLVPINDCAAVTGHVRDPARVLLLFRDKESTSTIPMSHTLASFAVSTTLDKVVCFDVVIFAISNPGKTLKSNVLIDVHLMKDNSKTFKYDDSVKRVPARLVCQHPLVPLGYTCLLYQASDNAKDSVKVLRVACIVNVTAFLAVFQPAPLYFKADLHPFALPSDHPMLTYPSSVKSSMTNPFDYYMPLDHLIPFVNVGDFIYVKFIPECLHLALVKSHTDNPFVVSVLLILLYKPIDFDETCYGANEAAQTFFAGSTVQDGVGESQVLNEDKELKVLSFLVGEVNEVSLNLKNYVLGKTVFLVLIHKENTPLIPPSYPRLMPFCFLHSSGNTR